jgi:hypothetical protein
MEFESLVKNDPATIIVDGELLLEAPVGVAWTCIIDYPSWQSYSTIERLSGVVGAEDEVFYLTKGEEGFEFPPHFTRTLKIVPESHIAWKTFAADVPEGTGFIGIIQFRVAPANDPRKTRFTYQAVYEFNGPFASAAEREAFKQGKYDDFAVLWASIGPKLHRLVASRVRADG